MSKSATLVGKAAYTQIAALHKCLTEKHPIMQHTPNSEADTVGQDKQYWVPVLGCSNYVIHNNIGQNISKAVFKNLLMDNCSCSKNKWRPSINTVFLTKWLVCVLPLPLKIKSISGLPSFFSSSFLLNQNTYSYGTSKCRIIQALVCEATAHCFFQMQIRLAHATRLSEPAHHYFSIWHFPKLSLKKKLQYSMRQCISISYHFSELKLYRLSLECTG